MMGNRDDSKFVGRHLIDDAVWEPAKEVPASVTSEDHPQRGIGQNDLDCSLELGDERKPKLDICALGVEGSRVMQFAQGRRNDDQFHFNEARTRARASAMGIT